MQQSRLTPEQRDDSRFAFRVYMVPKTANHAQGADLAVELIPPESDIAKNFQLVLKEVEKRKYLPSQIVEIIGGEGWTRIPQVIR